jgi:2'-5' RNA ligase
MSLTRPGVCLLSAPVSRFLSAEMEGSMENFAGVAERWPAGREDYYWHVLPGAEMVREHLANPYRELVERPGLVPVRPEWMHIAVQSLAPAAEITGTELATISRLVRGTCRGIPPFTVTAGRAEVWETSVVCPVRPAYMLRYLQHAISRASQEVTGGRCGAASPVYCPHLTLARAVTHVDSGPVRAWLSDCDAAEVALRVTGLVLVAQRHDRKEVTWRVIDNVDLTGDVS